MTIDTQPLILRELDGHHDGHGLNESIRITADVRDSLTGGNASHYYKLEIDGQSVGVLQFQHGSRNVAGSKPGVTEAALLTILIDRLEGFQAGPFACVENEQQLDLLRAALALTKMRADERARRGVLGRNEK